MKIKPWSKDQMNEIEEKDLLPDGIYKFHVLRGNLGQSKAGNQMLTVKVEVFGEKMASHHIYDYVLPDHPTMAWKLATFMASIGKQAEYDSGDVNVEGLTGASGMCKVGMQKAAGDWPAKNVIREWLPAEDGPTDEEIPF